MKTAKISTILVLALGLVICLPGTGKAAPMGTAFTYQGRLLDSNDVADGIYDFQFKLFDNLGILPNGQVGKTLDVNDIDIIDGYFTVVLDFGVDAFNGDARWLDIGVRPGKSIDPNDYTKLFPRQELTPLPYSIYSGKAGDLLLPYSAVVSSAESAFLVRNTGLGKAIQGIGENNDGVAGGSDAVGRSGIFGYNDNPLGFGVFGSSINGIGIKGYTFGETGRAGLFEVQNSANNYPALTGTTDGTGEGVYGKHTSSGNYGYLADVNNGVYGYSYNDSAVTGVCSRGRAVSGSATYTIGLNYGGYFTAEGSLGRGVYAAASGEYAEGVFGEATNTGNVYNYGGYFVAHGQHGTGVAGIANDSNGLNKGGYFRAEGKLGYGVEGYAPSDIGAGVYGHSAGNGVYGLSTGERGDGVEGNASGNRGRGVYGRSSGLNGAAVYGLAEDSSVVAIYGDSGSGTKAGYFEGDVHVTGQIKTSVSGGIIERATPIAYAYINSDGTVSTGTPNVSCTWNAASSRYEITIDGESYYYNNYVTVVTLQSLGVAKTGSIGGMLAVNIYNLSGTPMQSGFQFVTYKP